MGWSCTVAADETHKVLSEACRASTKTSNTFRAADGAFYFFEGDGVEHEDGSITGDVQRMTGDDPLTNPGPCRWVDSFRIDGGTGALTRAPAVLKALLTPPKAAPVKKGKS